MGICALHTVTGRNSRRRKGLESSRPRPHVTAAARGSVHRPVRKALARERLDRPPRHGERPHHHGPSRRRRDRRARGGIDLRRLRLVHLRVRRDADPLRRRPRPHPGPAPANPAVTARAQCHARSPGWPGHEPPAPGARTPGTAGRVRERSDERRRGSGGRTVSDRRVHSPRRRIGETAGRFALLGENRCGRRRGRCRSERGRFAVELMRFGLGSEASMTRRG